MPPTQQDVAALTRWWVDLQPEILPATRGLWFGITNLSGGDGYRSLYVAGCPTFDPDDADGEWATDYCWWPTARYVALADFAMLPDQPHANVLTYGADLVRTLDVTALPGIEGAAIAFDDGDLVLL
ncbi:hypothetical protein [Kribbella sp. NPDC051718]|uniref:hypothetical protein n=1 Tax=Kribbella sp. NPDC051718 TaxID=3155168 RepID=UPI003441174A